VADKLVTRSSLQRSLVVNALTKPLNVLVPAAVVVAGIALGALWLIGVAVVIYAVLALLTFFDAGEAERVGKRVYGSAAKGVAPPKQADLSRLAPPIAQQLGSARSEEARIRTAVQDADLPFSEVTTETDALVQAMESIAIRAQRVYDYLASHDPRPVQARLSQLQSAGQGDGELSKALQEQLAAYEKLSAQLQRFYDEMEHITASLATVGAQVVSMSAAGQGESGQRELAGQVRDLRDQVNALSDGMREAYAAQPDTP
jgi:methyl-accepting chemotaxis protein